MHAHPNMPAGAVALFTRPTAQWIKELTAQMLIGSIYSRVHKTNFCHSLRVVRAATSPFFSLTPQQTLRPAAASPSQLRLPHPRVVHAGSMDRHRGHGPTRAVVSVHQFSS
jgi:hypothetical protein